MATIKEITVFSQGDSRKLSTWSNVPYFFTKTLEARNIRVNRVDLTPSPFLKRVYNKAAYGLLRRFKSGTTRDYSRSLAHYLNLKIRIKKALRDYPDADANIFLTFSSSSAGMTGKPTVQFCDWTYDHHFRYFVGRKPDFLERIGIRREDAQIEGSELILALFPSVAEYMKGRYRNENIHYLGNVVNSLYDAPERELIGRKKHSNSLLLVGSAKYVDGAAALIRAFVSLKAKFPELVLNIIGMKISDFETLPADVICHGYLDKDVETQRDSYYELVRDAKIFINTTPKWGAFSATVESMWFHTPVIVTPYPDFLATFGEEIAFGRYCEGNLPGQVEEKILEILTSEDYESMCRSAHDAVRDFTWDSYIGKVLTKVESEIDRKSGPAAG